jgi:hypothetical protein
VAQQVAQPATSPVAVGWQNAQPAVASPVASAYGVPAYSGQAAALSIQPYAIAASKTSNIKGILALVFGLMSMVSSILIPIVGLIFALAAIVLASISLSKRKRGLAMAGLVTGILGLLVGIALIAHNVQNMATSKTDGTQKSNTLNSATTTTSSDLVTPCYSFTLDSKQTIQNNSGSCDSNIFTGNSIETSDEFYRVLGVTASSLNSSNFMSIAKSGIEKDLTESEPNAQIISEQPTTFAGSPAYTVDAKGSGYVLSESAVFHTTSNGENFFVVVHANSGSDVSLTTLEKDWKWQ